MDAPSEPFSIFRTTTIQPRRYWWTREQLEYATAPARPLSLSVRANWGGFYDGHVTETDLTATWKSGGHIVLGGNVTRSKVVLSAGKFTAIETGARAEYAFSTRIDVLGFAQYDNETDRVDFDFRFHWIPVIGDDVFVVWNSGYTTDPGARFRFPDRHVFSRPLAGALTLKYVHRIAP